MSQTLLFGWMRSRNPHAISFTKLNSYPAYGETIPKPILPGSQTIIGFPPNLEERVIFSENTYICRILFLLEYWPCAFVELDVCNFYGMMMKISAPQSKAYHLIPLLTKLLKRNRPSYPNQFIAKHGSF